MRALFLILAGSVAALVAALLLGPRLVDGELARQQLLSRLEAATGEPARVLGPTDLTFFPEPRLSIGQLVIGDAARGGATVSVERVDLVLGYAGLVGLGTGAREVRLIRPQVRSLALPGIAELGRLLERLRGDALPLDALSVVGGRVQLRDPSLPGPFEIGELDLEFARETGGGPLVLTGGGRWRDQAIGVELELRPTSAGPHAVRAHLSIGTGPTASRLAYRGALDVAGAKPRLDGELELAADTARLAPLLAALGAEHLAERMPPIGSFATRGRLRVHESRLESEGLRVATTAGELAIRLSLGLAEPSDVRLELEATRLELPSGPTPLARSDDPRLRELWAGPPPGLAGTVVARIGTLARSGEELRLVRLDARLPGDGTVALDALGAELPGTGDLELTGRLAQEPGGPAFRGRLVARVEDPRPLLAWLGRAVPLPEDRLGAVSITGEVTATPEGASLGKAEIRLAGARAQGSFAFLAGPPVRLRAMAQIDRLALDPWLDGLADELARGWLAGGPPIDLEAELDLTIERLAWRGIRAERVRFRGELAEGRLRLDELSTPALGGGSAGLAGSLGPATAVDLALELEAEQPARLARALELDPTLPALLEGPLWGRARLREDEAGRRLEAELATAEGRMRAELALARGSLEVERASITGELADTAALAARLAGRAAIAPGLTGRLSGELEARRMPAGWRLDGRIGTARLALEAGLELTDAHGASLLRGRLGLERVDLASLADLYRLLEVPLGLPGGPLRAWPGAWPRRPFGPPRLPPVDLDLALDFGLEREDGTSLGRGTATLAFAGRALALDAIDLPMASGRLAGRLLVEFGAASGRVEGEMRLASAALATLAEAFGVPEPAAGTLDLEAAFASEGRSPAELVANASGRGAFTLRDLAAPSLSTAEGSAGMLLHGALVLERGVARADDPSVETGGTAAGRARLSFDLAAWILDLDLALPGGRLRLLGPPDRLHRYIEPAPARP